MADSPKSYLAVMVSSTFADHEAHRAAIIRAIQQAGLRPTMIEYAGAHADADIIEASLRHVRDSAAYVGLIGHRYGQIPQDPSRNPDALSITELELNEARRLGRPILLFVMSDDHPVKSSEVETDPDKTAKLRALKSKPNLLYHEFRSVEDLARKASLEIARLAKNLEDQAQPTLSDEAAASPEGEVELPGSPEVRPATDKKGAKKERPAQRAKPVLSPRDPEVALLDPDDPWASAVRDHSGSSREAEAFAAMISARQFMPPLAVGIFGDWGSGKSFFMRLLHDAIAARAESGGNPADAGEISFTRHIVQIRFNAWHYAETNLWASLVDHIFTCLDRWAEHKKKVEAADAVFDQLATARRLTAEAAEVLIERRRERADAANLLHDAQQQVAEKRAELEKAPATYVTAAWQAFASSQKMNELKSAADQLGLAGATESAAAFTAASTAVDHELSRWALLRSGTLRALAAPLIILGVAAGILLLPPLMAWLVSLVGADIPPAATIVSAILVPIGAALAAATRLTNGALDKLRAARTDFETELTRRTEAERAAEDQARALLAEREAAVVEAEERLRQATERAAEAAREYNLQNGKGRVLRFVRDRLASGEYARHLSFVATVRKDFQELSELMTAADADADVENARALYQAHVEAILKKGGDLLSEEERDKLRATIIDPKAPPAPVFERIVLYIDDLDRCPNDQVIRVLQAIHLLLTFPLFVVFVAVDVRWLRGALAKQHAGQIEADNDSASAGDYLEKIFQIPYWVRPMGVGGTRSILGDRMGPAQMPSSPSPPKALAGGAPQLHGGAPSTPAPPPSPTLPPAVLEPLRTVSLRLTDDERIFINAVADILDGSPRRTLRFINTYRIIKASLPGDEVLHLEHQGHRALLTLLALNVASDEIYPDIVGLIEEEKESPLEKLKNRFVSSPLGMQTGDARVMRSLTLFEHNRGDQKDLYRYVKLVARFSFNPNTRLVGATTRGEEQAPTIR